MEMPWLVKYLLLKNEELNLDPQHTPKESEVESIPIITALGKQRQEDPCCLLVYQPYLVSLGSMRGPLSKDKAGRY